MGTIILRNEDDAWGVLQRCLTADADFPQHVIFSGWPMLHVSISPGDGTITPEIERAMSLLRKAVYRCYALYRYGTPDTHRLTRQDRHELAPEWQVGPGSTRARVSLMRAAAHFMRVTLSGMSPTLRVITILGLGLMVCSTTALVASLHFNADVAKERARIEGQTDLATRNFDTALAMTREHNTQMQLLAAAYQRDATNVIRFAATDLIPWRPALLEMAPYMGTLSINNAITIDAKPAKRIAKIMKDVAAKQRQEMVRSNNPVIETAWITTVSASRVLSPPMKLGIRA